MTYNFQVELARLDPRADDAEARKARGAFFTPAWMASFLSAWAVRHPNDAVFEPSCGEAAFLLEAGRRLRSLGSAAVATDQLQGVDVDGPSVDAARTRLAREGLSGSLTVGSFFEKRPTRRFEAVVGNPPYVRYQAFAGKDRLKGIEAALTQGVRLNGLASSWAAFVVHASSFVAPTGRLALVLPAELLSVNYAAPVRRYLMQRFATVRLVLFEERVFPGVSEEVVLLLAEGTGPTDHCELIQTKNASTLDGVVQHRWTPSDTEEKWMAALLPETVASDYAAISNSAAFSRLDQWGQTSLGMVTGNNKYFALGAEAVRQATLKPGDLLRICPPGSRHLRGLGFTETAWNDLVMAGASGYLFCPPTTDPSPAAQAYIDYGSKLRVNEAYKCRVRSPWWKVPHVSIPDAFLTYMNHDTPRIVTNRAGVAYLNSVHGITFAQDRRQIAMDLLPIAALNTVTILGSELVGRSYGGGLLKIEPKECDRLPVPSLDTVEAAAPELRALRPQLAKGLRRGNLLEVVAEVDRVLRAHARIPRPTLERLRAARATLFNRRVSRAAGI